MLPQLRDLEPGHVSEVAGSEIDSVPVDREAPKLELDETADEAGAPELHWSPQRIASYYAGAPALHGEPELQVEDSARERAQELGFRLGLAFVLCLMLLATFNDLVRFNLF